MTYFFSYYVLNWKFYHLLNFFFKFFLFFSLKKTNFFAHRYSSLTSNLIFKNKKFFKMNSFKNSFKNGHQTLKKLRFVFKKYNYSLFRCNELFLTQFPLLGSLILSFNWHFENKKLWFRSFMLENFIKKNKENSINKNILYKNLYFDKYFYFSRVKFKFNDFKNYVKITNLGFKSKNEPFLLSKPYSIFNNSSFLTAKSTPSLFVLHSYFKQYVKIENYLIRTSRLHKNKSLAYSFIFYYFSKKFFSGINFYQNFWNLKKKFTSFFGFSNFLNKKIKKNKKSWPMLFKKQLIISNKFLKNLKFRSYYSCFKNNKSYFLKKSIKKNQKILNYVFFYFFFKKATLVSNKNFTTSRPFVIYLLSMFKSKQYSNKISSNNINFNFFKIQNSRFISWNNFKSDINPLFKKIKICLKKLKFVFFSPKYNLSFVTTETGFMNLTQGIMNYFEIDFYTHNVKKKYYSFPLKNELQKFIIKKCLKTNSALHLKFFKKIKQDDDFDQTRVSFYDFKKRIITDPNPNSRLFFNHFSIPNSVFLGDCFYDCFYDENHHYSLFIKKIKFKPGYMTFWREARNVFKIISNLNLKYQKRLTRYLIKFNKILKFNLYLNTEMSLRNILQRTRFFFDWNTTDFFLTQGLFYVNGLPCFNYSFQLYVGDFIQMIVHIKYYILYRWMSHWILKKKTKLKIKTKKKLTISTSDEDKTKTNKYPTWILFNKTLSDDSAKYLEIDFFTLSIFIIYEPFTWRDLNSYSHFGNRFSIINMYNWKYIT